MASIHMIRNKDSSAHYLGLASCGKIGVISRLPDMVTCKICRKTAAWKIDHQSIHGRPNTKLDRQPPLPVRTDGGLLQDGKP
jgi:hypothetical protein